MTKGQLFLRTFGWAAVGFLLTNGVVLAFAQAVDEGAYSTGAKSLVLSAIAAALAGLAAALGVLRFGDSPGAKALNQGVQMLAAGVVTLALADLSGAAAVVFAQAALKLVVSAVLGALQAYLVNIGGPPEPA